MLKNTKGYYMWTYKVRSGALYKDGAIIGKGYSGYGTCKNKSSCENIKNKGPIPRGKYIIGQAFDSSKTGPYVLPLKPYGHTALGRTAFQIHGDKKSSPGNASTGCIILFYNYRKQIGQSNDNILKVE